MFPANAGHQMDMQHLWQQIQELSMIIAQNRESTASLVRRADELKSRGNLAGDIPPKTGETSDEGRLNGNGAEIEPQELHALRSKKKALCRERAKIDSALDETAILLNDYETSLEKIMEGLRIYAHEHSMAIINIHSSYNQQLANARAVNCALRETEIANAGRLTVLSHLLREAYQLETALEPEIVIQGLMAENIALRTELGIENRFEADTPDDGRMQELNKQDHDSGVDGEVLRRGGEIIRNGSNGDVGSNNGPTLGRGGRGRRIHQ